MLYGRPNLFVLYARQKKVCSFEWLTALSEFSLTQKLLSLDVFKESLYATPPYPWTSLTSADKCFKVLSVFQGLKHRCLFLVMLHAIDLTANLMSSIGAPSRHDLLGKGVFLWGFFLEGSFNSQPSFTEFILILFHFSTSDLYTKIQPLVRL